MSVPTTTNIDVATQILSLIGQDSSTSSDTDALGRSLRACSRDQLLNFARQLGITGVTKLAKDSLAGRVAAALGSLRTSEPLRTSDLRAPERETAGQETDATVGTLGAKFDLGPEATDAAVPQNIPWGYGVDRIVAMAVNPVRLYVYWEVTDASIEAARKSLGASGAGAWLCLRIYDTTGRLFDGTNAHSYFDEGIDRGVRQWFFEIGKPTSTTCVEIGLKSAEGYFVKISRSGRVDFPRDAPVGGGSIEWLTVRSATGWAGQPVEGGAPLPDGVGGGAPGGGGGQGWEGWTDGAGFPAPGAGPSREAEPSWEWRETVGETTVTELGRYEWVGPTLRSEWAAGPFSYPVDAPSMLEQHETGEVSMRSENGHVHVVYGPWQVVIRGIGARAERRVLATWEYRRTIEVPGGVERTEERGWWEPIAPGASELRWVKVGASERRWEGSSELLVRGGSEVYMMGASERLVRGASERLYKGASEWMYRGASERLMRGASELLMRGASERLIAGGGEAREAGRVGASENLFKSGAGISSTPTEPLPYPRSERS